MKVSYFAHVFLFFLDQLLSGVRLTGQDGEDGCEGIELESVDDVAGVEQLQAHQTEADHQEQDVEYLWYHRQPQHTCKHTWHCYTENKESL